MAFDAFYRGIHGERWDALRAALERPPLRGGRSNPFVPQARPPAGAVALARPRGCFEARGPLPPPPPGPLAPYYLMDLASVVAAEALGVRPEERVLDLCAAPGGKALVLAEAIGPEGELVANDRSGARRARLARVLDEHLPRERRARVRVTGHDAERWSLFERDAYDRVLLDAPCSSEAHVLAEPRALADWSPARSRGLARRQFAMLASALEVARPGGRIVYATCALVPAENEGVVERLLADPRRRGRARILPPDAPFGEPSGPGWSITPDRHGWGPIWFALIERAQ